jgi:tetratricopeptide (TPR) repeat protein
LDQRVWIGTGAGLLAGFLIGYFASSAKPVVPAPLAPTAQAPSNAMPGASPENLALQQTMFAAQQAVERDPKNLQAWIALGNGYFDTHQPEKAIEAYAKALELNPHDPNILTDQGIMYRATGAFDKAIANFEKANKINPKHVQSLYNLGIVYAHDLNAKDKALKAWNKVIATAPTSQQAELSRKGIEELKSAAAPR